MVERKPDFTDEDVGIQAFHLRRGQAVEKAMSKIRQGLGNSFYKISKDELDTLEWFLGEIWSGVGFYEWENLRFSLLKYEDIEKLIEIAKEVMTHKKLGIHALSEGIELIREAARQAGLQP